MNAKTEQLLQEAFNKRASLFEYTNAVRLVNGLGDKLPGLVIEQYDRHLVCHFFEKSWLSQKAELAAFLKQYLDPVYLIFKERIDPQALKAEAINATIAIQEAPSKTLVHENGLEYEVDLNDGINSGLFLDMRANRRIVSSHAKDRKVFNGFSYTCSFGVSCRAAGAESVVNVDISRKALERGAVNYRLNDLKAGEQEFTKADCLFYLERAAKKENRFDLIILDPPSFARVEGKTFSVKKDLPALVDLAVRVLHPDGILFIATNFSALSSQELEEDMRRAAGKRVASLEHFGQDIDFPGSGKMAESYLAALLVKLT